MARRQPGSGSEFKAEVVSFDGADAGELLLAGVDVEGVFDVLETLLNLGVLVEPVLASRALDRDAIEIALSRSQLGGEFVDERFADFVPALLDL